MQYPIKQKAAITFSRTFYQELAKGKDVDDAFQYSRYRMFTDDPRSSYIRNVGTTILYWRSRNGIILQAQESSPQVAPRQANSSSDIASNSSWTTQAQRIWNVGTNELFKGGPDELERLPILTELQQLAAEFSQYEDPFDIQQKLIELSPRALSNPKLGTIIAKMIDECRKKE
jgi:hypothetical protein